MPDAQATAGPAMPTAIGTGEMGDAPVPVVTVIVPAFNAERFIGAALDNIQAQGVAPLEIIVIDDGSTDRTATLARAHPAQPRVVPRKNGGPGAARNTGLDIARGPVIAFLDADDAWPAGSLARRLDILQQRPEIWMVLGLVRFEHLDGQALPLKTWAAPNLGAGLYRREVFAQVGDFEPSLLLEDIDWFWRARDAAVPTFKLDEITLHYRRHVSSFTASKTWIELGLGKVIRRALARREPGRAPSSLSELINVQEPR